MIGEAEPECGRDGQPLRLQRRDPIEQLLQDDLAPAPSLEDFTDGVASTHGLHLHGAAETGDDFERAREQGEPFAVILAPGCPVLMPIIVAVLGPVWGLSLDGTHHAVLRRRGILAEGLPFAEAEAIGGQLAFHGQQVMLVAQRQAEGFGRCLDVFTMREEAGGARFSSQTEALMVNWDQVLCLGCGLVKIAPTAPSRLLCDLWLEAPARRLFLWGNSFVPPRDLGASSPVRFKAFIQWLEKQIPPSAIRSQALQRWLADTQPEPGENFASQIEYDNFLRWHLMAYYAPNRSLKGNSATV